MYGEASGWGGKLLSWIVAVASLRNGDIHGQYCDGTADTAQWHVSRSESHICKAQSFLVPPPNYCVSCFDFDFDSDLVLSVHCSHLLSALSILACGINPPKYGLFNKSQLTTPWRTVTWCKPIHLLQDMDRKMYSFLRKVDSHIYWPHDVSLCTTLKLMYSYV